MSAQPVKRRSPEKRIAWNIIKNLHTLGFHVSSFSQPHRAKQTKGIPDIHAAHHRYGALWIEVKEPARRNHARGGLTIDQLQWHVNAKRAGVRVIVAYELADVLKELGIS